MSTEDRTVLKENEIFLVGDLSGDISSRSSEGHGLYWRDTRFLSVYELVIAGLEPTLLSSAGEYSFMSTLQFANAAFTTEDGRSVPPRTISIRRNRFLRDGLHERIGLFNYNSFDIRVSLVLTVGADFRDMFDVRGYTTRARHGAIDLPVVDGNRVVLGYLGLDNVRRQTTVELDPEPVDVEVVPSESQGLIWRVAPGLSGQGDQRTEWSVTPPTARARFNLVLPSKRAVAITIHVVPEVEGQRPESRKEHASLDTEFLVIRDSYHQWDSEATSITTDHELLNQVIHRAAHDLRLLSDRTADGLVPVAGIPWFSVPFGRDSLITSIQTLMFQPDIAYGTLRYLARHQGQRVDDWRDEEPGKILHEVRMGEVATLGEVPHTPYYGSIDSTPLFLVALGELLDWTADRELAESLRPSVAAALAWIDRHGDLDGDGYVEYRSRSLEGIRNQGWKDSRQAICYPDGRVVEPPIALAEVQGYVYDARKRMSRYFRWLGDGERADELERQAETLKTRFKRDFWLEGREFWALALDAEKRPVAAVSSNPGHCVWSGLLDRADGRLAARRLLQDDMSCGWGMRTLSSAETAFNPMSYHNGSVWPHDTSLIAAGFKRLGLDREATQLISDVFEAAVRFPGGRLPELYCGFTRDRRYFSMPAQYPVSCSPQAWAAGSVFLMLQTMLGLRVDAAKGRVWLRPRLVDWVQRVSVRRLRVAGHRLDFELHRDRDRTRVEVWDSGGLELVVEPVAEPR